MGKVLVQDTPDYMYTQRIEGLKEQTIETIVRVIDIHKKENKVNLTDKELKSKVISIYKNYKDTSVLFSQAVINYLRYAIELNAMRVDRPLLIRYTNELLANPNDMQTVARITYDSLYELV